MTTNISKQVIPVRKRTPSKAWKDKLLRACLDRVRRNKEAKTPSSVVQPARLLVEHEMMQQGISLVSPCTAINHNVFPDHALMEAEKEGEDTAPRASHYISEQELFELLEEVEAEIERTEARQVDEILQFEEMGLLDLEQRISEFQLWTDESRLHADSTVLCPICSRSNLQQDISSGRIVCPNAMDGSCSFDLTNHHKILLEELREFLRGTYEEHGSWCSGRLSFNIISGVNNADSMIQGQENSLVAQCASCGTNKTIA